MNKKDILIKNFFTKFKNIVVTLTMCALFYVVLAIPVMLLWNWLIPTIFGFTKITLIQAWGISILCGLLFGQSSSEKK